MSDPTNDSSFRYGAVVPHKGKQYLVLIQDEKDENGEDQLVICRMDDTGDGTDLVVEPDPTIVSAVFKKYTKAMES